MNPSAHSAPLVSITIPAFNCQETIAATLQSCLNQSFKNIEIIVVNDGSTDGTGTILEQFRDHIVVVCQKNGGLAAARNAALDAARGQYIAWMDADDLMHPRRIEAQVMALHANPAAILVSTDFTAFSGDSPDFEKSHIGSYYGAVKRSGDIRHFYPLVPSALDSRDSSTLEVLYGTVYPSILWGNFVHPPTVMVRREALMQAGRFDELLKNNCDYDLLVRLSKLGGFAFINAPLLRYRYRENQMSSPRNLALIKLETVKALQKAMNDDPSFYAANKQIVNERIAETLLGCAKLTAETERLKALTLALESLKYSARPAQLTTTLLHVCAPDLVRQIIRSLRSTNARRP